MTVEPFLDQELEFLADRIVVKECGTPVMMSWERPLMQRMAEVVTARGGDVLEVGFGMGISCDEVQKRRPRSHTIIEAHPQIVERANAWARNKASVRIVAARWQEVIDRIGSFDGVAFDVFGGVGQRAEFCAKLGRILRPAGVATMWMGDDQSLPATLVRLLRKTGFVWRGTRVIAIPDRRCTYSQTNEFWLPVITRAGSPRG